MVFLAATVTLIGAQAPTTGDGRVTIPRTWDDRAIEASELPLADPRSNRKHVPADFYYRMPVRRVLKSYPIYHPKFEPTMDGKPYREWLESQKPQEILTDFSTLRTEADWRSRGAILGRDVFEAPLGVDADDFGTIVRLQDVRNPAWYEAVGVPLADDGIMPFARYVVTEQGVRVGNLSCAMCHTRVLKRDGAPTMVLQGGPGNFPFDRVIAVLLEDAAKSDPAKTLAEQRAGFTLLFAAPWLSPDPISPAIDYPLDQVIAAYAAIPGGALARHGTSVLSPAQVPDLVGVSERRYLDRTGLARHRDIGDLMRYAATNQDGDALAQFGPFTPLEALLGKVPPAEALGRYSDEQLYALARFLYSLQPPPNPNLPTTPAQSEVVARGQAVFSAQGCGACHTPPAYTNNKLLPVVGFTVPRDHPARQDVLTQRIDTDPYLAMKTRRGTGFYKVPSLKGVWYRGLLEHNGSMASLEDWFDPRRVRDDYVPTGWKGPVGTKTRAVKGHQFGLALPAADRAALIAFLRTL
jgi:hypothetical protein